MRHYSKREILGAALLGGIFIVFGVDMIVRPTEMNMIPAGLGKVRGISGSDSVVHVSKTGSQVYGGLAILVGVGVTWMALYRGAK
jgi:hypothetical protein